MPQPNTTFTGRVFLDTGVPAAQMTLRAYGKSFGGIERLLGETKARDGGVYELSLATPGTGAVELRAVKADGKEVVISSAIHNPAEKEAVNLVAPAAAGVVDAEWTRLTSDLAIHVGAPAALAQAKETKERQDLTLLSHATGWDPRIIALAATAARLAGGTGIVAEALYAGFRAGLPTDPPQLALVSSTGFSKALRAAKTAGVVELSESAIQGAAKAHDAFARTERKKAKLVGGLSTLDEVLAATPMLDARERAVFESTYAAHSGAPKELWVKLEQQGIPREKVARLQVQGKLAQLTLNNLPLMSALLLEIEKSENLKTLADKDLYQADAWKTRLNRIASSSDGGIARLIPESYVGKTTDERLESYVRDLAHKVSLAYPTRVVARRIEKGELSLSEEDEDTKQATAKFIRYLNDAGYELGSGSLEKVLGPTKNVDIPGLTKPQLERAVRATKKVTRVYQFAPSEASMKVILELGFRSAADVIHYPLERFLAEFGSFFRSEEEARLVYRKAEQIGSVTETLLLAARRLDDVTVYAGAAPALVRQQAKQSLIKEYPTLETLFGSLDFCECQHCSSVLSPAAYLVDLLEFVNEKDAPWARFLEHWRRTHHGESYESGLKKPFEALIERRPDLPHLELSCDNTHTPLPYIDVVNEILEYYVAHRALDESAARSSDGLDSADLLAEPQNVERRAYDVLRTAVYPLRLPFDLSLATVRRLLGRFELPLPKLLEVFRPTDELFATGVSYGRASICFEQLGLSPAEVALLTGPDLRDRWYVLYGMAEKPARDQLLLSPVPLSTPLPNAKNIARRLDITYQDLARLTMTWFVNPARDLLVALNRLGISVEDVFRYHRHAGYIPFSDGERLVFELKLVVLTKKYHDSKTGAPFDARRWLNERWTEGAFEEVLVLADRDQGCSFDETRFQKASGAAPDALALVKLSVFVRLWRKLGWTIEETDAALRTFMPAKSVPFRDALRSALLNLAHLRELEQKLAMPQGRRARLLTLWSSVETTGPEPLYANLFLTPEMKRANPVFDHPVGDYLSEPQALLMDHAAAVQAALGLKAAEIADVLAALALAPATAPLSLATLSHLLRHRVLAEGLGLTVRELLVLKELSGIDPFQPLALGPIDALAADHLFTHTLRFVDMAQALDRAKFSLSQLNHLLSHRGDNATAAGEKWAEPVSLYRQLRAMLEQLRGDVSLSSEAGSLADESLRQRLALIWPPEIVQTFLGMWTGGIEYEASEDAPPDAALAEDVFAGKLRIRVVYDRVRQRQRLLHRGVLGSEELARLGSVAGSELAQRLLTDVAAQSRSFFLTHLQRRTVAEGRIAGFMDVDDFERLFPPPASIDPAVVQAQRQQRMERLLAVLVPHLERRLFTERLVGILSRSLAADPALVERLLTSTALLHDPEDVGQPLLALFAPTETSGVTLRYFASEDTSGPPLASAVQGDAIATGDRPIGAHSARIAGFLEVLACGPHRFHAQLGSTSSTATLRFDHLADGIELRPMPGAPEPSALVELQAGVTYRFELEVHHLGVAGAQLQFESEILPRGSTARLRLHPARAVERLRAALVLLQKAASLTQTLGLTARELAYFLTHRAEFGDIDLNLLPIEPTTTVPTASAGLLSAIVRLTDYARLKTACTDGADALIDVFERSRREIANPVTAAAAESMVFAEVTARFAEIVGRDAGMVRAVATALGFAASSMAGPIATTVVVAGFTTEQGLGRLFEALQLVHKVGGSAAQLVHWTGIASPARTSDPSDESGALIAQEVRDALRSHFTRAEWQRAARPLFDELRKSKRDALVGYLVNRLDLDRPEQLYEYFLLDPGMEPVVLTSRIQLAISSVQLFIQRCFLNLESNVHPSTLNAKHWEWMKRFRLWEANRKIFLFPENWLEPEFRHDKTHLGAALESTLLQEDASAETAEEAFFQYLKGLDEIARLEMVAQYCEEKPLDPAANTVHVLGRTYNQPHRYFYRQHSHGRWTPWEPVSAQLEGNHPFLTVWRGRLHLFWIGFFDRAAGTALSSGEKMNELFNEPPAQAERTVDVQLNWSERLQGKWTERRGTEFGKPLSQKLPEGEPFDANEVELHVGIEADGTSDRLIVSLGQPFEQSLVLTGRNAPPELGGDQHRATFPLSGLSPLGDRIDLALRATLRKGGVKSALAVTYETRIVDGVPSGTDRGAKILYGAPSAYTILAEPKLFETTPRKFEDLITPFFYQDQAQSFFVEPTMTEVTIEQWDGWIVSDGASQEKFDHEGFFETVPIEALIPRPRPGDFPQIDAWDAKVRAHAGKRLFDGRALFAIRPPGDWVSNPGTVLMYGDEFISREGRVDANVIALASRSGAGKLKPNHAASQTILTEIAGATRNVHAESGVVVVGKAGISSAALSSTKARLGALVHQTNGSGVVVR